MIIGPHMSKSVILIEFYRFTEHIKLLIYQKRLYDQLSVQNVYNHCKHTYFRLHKYSGIFIFRQLIFGRRTLVRVQQLVCIYCKPLYFRPRLLFIVQRNISLRVYFLIKPSYWVESMKINRTRK